MKFFKDLLSHKYNFQQRSKNRRLSKFFKRKSVTLFLNDFLKFKCFFNKNLSMTGHSLAILPTFINFFSHYDARQRGTLKLGGYNFFLNFFFARFFEVSKSQIFWFKSSVGFFFISSIVNYNRRFFSFTWDYFYQFGFKRNYYFASVELSRHFFVNLLFFRTFDLKFLIVKYFHTIAFYFSRSNNFISFLVYFFILGSMLVFFCGFFLILFFLFYSCELSQYALDVTILLSSATFYLTIFNETLYFLLLLYNYNYVLLIYEVDVFYSFFYFSFNWLTNFLPHFDVFWLIDTFSYELLSILWIFDDFIIWRFGEYFLLEDFVSEHSIAIFFFWFIILCFFAGALILLLLVYFAVTYRVTDLWTILLKWLYSGEWDTYSVSVDHNLLPSTNLYDLFAKNYKSIKYYQTLEFFSRVASRETIFGYSGFVNLFPSRNTIFRKWQFAKYNSFEVNTKLHPINNLLDNIFFFIADRSFGYVSKFNERRSSVLYNSRTTFINLIRKRLPFGNILFGVIDRFRSYGFSFFSLSNHSVPRYSGFLSSIFNVVKFFGTITQFFFAGSKIDRFRNFFFNYQLNLLAKTSQLVSATEVTRAVDVANEIFKEWYSRRYTASVLRTSLNLVFRQPRFGIFSWAHSRVLDDFTFNSTNANHFDLMEYSTRTVNAEDDFLHTENFLSWFESSKSQFFYYIGRVDTVMNRRFASIIADLRTLVSGFSERWYEPPNTGFFPTSVSWFDESIFFYDGYLQNFDLFDVELALNKINIPDSENFEFEEGVDDVEERVPDVDHDGVLDTQLLFNETHILGDESRLHYGFAAESNEQLKKETLVARSFFEFEISTKLRENEMETDVILDALAFSGFIGGEYDMLRNKGETQRLIHFAGFRSLNYSTAIAVDNDTFSSFYDEVSDYYWTNSDALIFRNYFFYPVGRFFFLWPTSLNNFEFREFFGSTVGRFKMFFARNVFSFFFNKPFYLISVKFYFFFSLAFFFLFFLNFDVFTCLCAGILIFFIVTAFALVAFCYNTLLYRAICLLKMSSYFDFFLAAYLLVFFYFNWISASKRGAAVAETELLGPDILGRKTLVLAINFFFNRYTSASFTTRSTMYKQFISKYLYSRTSFYFDFYFIFFSVSANIINFFNFFELRGSTTNMSYYKFVLFDNSQQWWFTNQMLYKNSDKFFYFFKIGDKELFNQYYLSSILFRKLLALSFFFFTNSADINKIDRGALVKNCQPFFVLANDLILKAGFFSTFIEKSDSVSVAWVKLAHSITKIKSFEFFFVNLWGRKFRRFFFVNPYFFKFYWVRFLGSIAAYEVNNIACKIDRLQDKFIHDINLSDSEYISSTLNLLQYQDKVGDLLEKKNDDVFSILLKKNKFDGKVLLDRRALNNYNVDSTKNSNFLDLLGSEGGQPVDSVFYGSLGRLFFNQNLLNFVYFSKTSVGLRRIFDERLFENTYL